MISLRKYAKSREERGLPSASHAAIQRAAKDGRLLLSLGKGKRGPAIADPDLADLELEAGLMVWADEETAQTKSEMHRIAVSRGYAASALAIAVLRSECGDDLSPENVRSAARRLAKRVHADIYRYDGDNDRDYANAVWAIWDAAENLDEEYVDQLEEYPEPEQETE